MDHPPRRRRESGVHACGEDIAVHELDLHGRRGEREARTIDDQRAANAEVVDHEGPPLLAHGEVARAHLEEAGEGRLGEGEDVARQQEHAGDGEAQRRGCQRERRFVVHHHAGERADRERRACDLREDARHRLPGPRDPVARDRAHPTGRMAAKVTRACGAATENGGRDVHRRCRFAVADVAPVGPQLIAPGCEREATTREARRARIRGSRATARTGASPPPTDAGAVHLSGPCRSVAARAGPKAARA